MKSYFHTTYEKSSVRWIVRNIPAELRWLLLVSLAVVLAAPGLSSATTITVDTPVEFNPFGCSLRDAIIAHNAQQNDIGCAAGSGNDTIVFNSNIADVFLNAPLPTISGSAGSVTIQGLNPDENTVTLHGAYFTVERGATFTLSFITEKIVGLDFRTSQSIILNNGGTVTVQSSTLSNANPDNLMPQFGGVIDNEKGTVAVNNSFFTNSRASTAGGAIYNNKGDMTFDNEGFGITSNQAPRGGAIYNNSGQIRISSYFFDISNNTASIAGGAIYSKGGQLGIARDIPPPHFNSSANLAGNQAPMGGAIYAKGGRVNLSGLEISGNSTSNGNGAGLVADNVTKATITQTYFHDNNATNNGGAIYGTNRSSVIMTAGTFAHDIAQGDGGIFLTGAAIATDNHSQLAVVNSTFLGDSPEQNSESILISKGIGRIVNSTFDEATLTVGSNATLSLRNSILAGVHCDGPTSRGLNIQFGDVAGCQNIPLADPALDPDGLQFNGGLTPTIAILRGSHAIDAIPIGKCTDQNGNRLKTDQRGFMRPAPQHKSCDIGAFEFNG